MFGDGAQTIGDGHVPQRPPPGYGPNKNTLKSYCSKTQ